MDSDESIIRLCLDGRPNMFRHLMSRYQHSVIAYLTGRLRNKDLVEEATQETFVRAYSNLSRIKKPDKFFYWLMGIADRVTKEEYRKNKKEVGNKDVENIAYKGTQQDEDYELKEAVSKLEDPYRQVILLKFYSNLTCQEIAENLDVPLNTITKQLSRAYKKLRNILEENQRNGGVI